jgi:hypothetical protein
MGDMEIPDELIDQLEGTIGWPPPRKTTRSE